MGVALTVRGRLGRSLVPTPAALPGLLSRTYNCMDFAALKDLFLPAGEQGLDRAPSAAVRETSKPSPATSWGRIEVIDRRLAPFLRNQEGQQRVHDAHRPPTSGFLER